MLMALDTAKQHSMHCWAWNRVYVKSNGRIPCWCDTGEPHTIIKPDYTKDDFVLDVVNSEQLRQMRLTINQNNKTFIPECNSCCCLLTQGDKKHKRYADSIADLTVTNKSVRALKEMQIVAIRRKWPFGSIDRISEMQVEPSFACNLRCPGCLQGTHPNPLETEEKPYIMPYDIFTKIIDSIVNHAVKLERIAFVGRGEPTLNKNLPNIISYARANIPNLIMSMDTNSTHTFKEEYLSLNWMNCSIDGSTKESYDTYRYNGDFNSAIEFMTAAATTKALLKRSCKIRWKYILFNTTEHPSLLNKAQQMALDIGIDELNFVITATGSQDRSVTPARQMNSLNAIQAYIANNKIFPNIVVSRS